MLWSKSRYAQERGFPLDKEGEGLLTLCIKSFLAWMIKTMLLALVV
jgi:hypothetical protein